MVLKNIEVESRKAMLSRMAIAMMQTKGYLGFGLRDLADAASIRAPSVYNHFPSKEDLARQAMCSYRERQYSDLLNLTGSAAKRLNSYLEIFADMLRDDEKICLGLSLAADRNLLPPEVIDEVRRFAEQNAEWITMVWKLGLSDGTIRSELSSQDAGNVILGALEGLMLFALVDASPASAFLTRSIALIRALGVEQPAVEAAII